MAHDLHPDYLSTRWARETRPCDPWSGCNTIMLTLSVPWPNATWKERSSAWPATDPGFGPDGGVWGCEMMVADRVEYERRGHLDYVPLPGGDAAVKEPWRMAVSHLKSAFGSETTRLDLDVLARQDPGKTDPGRPDYRLRPFLAPHLFPGAVCSMRSRPWWGCAIRPRSKVRPPCFWRCARRRTTGRRPIPAI